MSDPQAVSASPGDGSNSSQNPPLTGAAAGRSQSEIKATGDSGQGDPKSTDRPAQGQYDPELADRAVSIKRLARDRRFRSSIHTLLALISAAAIDTLVRDRLKRNRDRTESEKRRRRAARVKQALIELGATFIKLGQFLSVRKDIISEELAEELSSLQDRVPPFSIEVLRATVERELGAPPEVLFKEFDPTPIASASIGQVHRARLHDGRGVVVKVQRPDLQDIFYQDLGYMRFIARIGPLIRPNADWESWLALTGEFGRTLFEEIDYIKEGRNADRIRQILKENKTMRIPRVYWKLTARRVLTLEYLPGIKINQVGELQRLGIDPVSIGNNLVSAYMEQVLSYGFFHADPHAGNLAVGPDGRIVIYDFGMVGEISPAQREAILGCIASVINCNAPELLKNLTALGIIQENAKHESMMRAVQPFIEYYKGKQIKELDFSDLEHDIDQIAMDRSLKLPPSLAYLLRTGSSLEGIARSLHPNFSFVEAAKPTVKKWALANPAQAYLALGYLTQGKIFGQKGVFSEEGLVRLFGGKGSSSGPSGGDSGRSPTGTERRKSRPRVAGPTAEELELEKEAARRLQEIRKLEGQIYILKREVKTQAKNRVNLLGTMLFWVSLSLVFWGITSKGGSPQFSEFFLIGNGVMVAIIIWQMIRPLDLASRKQSNRSKGRRR